MQKIEIGDRITTFNETEQARFVRIRSTRNWPISVELKQVRSLPEGPWTEAIALGEDPESAKTSQEASLLGNCLDLAIAIATDPDAFFEDPDTWATQYQAREEDMHRSGLELADLEAALDQTLAEHEQYLKLPRQTNDLMAHLQVILAAYRTQNLVFRNKIPTATRNLDRTPKLPSEAIHP